MNPINSVDDLLLDIVVDQKTPSRATLARTIKRASTFLVAMGTKHRLRARFEKAGYRKRDHREGWTLLGALGYGLDTGGPVAEEPNEPMTALAAIKEWEVRGFRRARAALNRHFPEQADFVFAGLGEIDGILAVMTFLERLNALESAPDRKATRKVDHAALALLEQRGIGKRERATLQKLADTASTDANAPVAPTPRNAGKVEDQLLALHRWYEDWAETARAVFKRRGDLILLGLAHRQKKKAAAKPKPTPAQPPAVPAPVLIENAPPSRAA
jgi:hypothetical protein